MDITDSFRQSKQKPFVAYCFGTNFVEIAKPIKLLQFCIVLYCIVL